MTTPKIVFIVPYRDREQQKFFFSKHMSYVLENYEPREYEIYFSHQLDNRTFNRGAMKNIGFLAMKQKYPDDYKKITFVFNDVDTIPYKNYSIMRLLKVQSNTFMVLNLRLVVLFPF